MAHSSAHSHENSRVTDWTGYPTTPIRGKSPAVTAILRICMRLFPLSGLLASALSSACLAGPVISEFLASNDSGEQDEDGDHSDWIEIHNPELAPIELDGWALTPNTSSSG